MANNLIQTSGGQPQKQPKYVPIFMDRAFTGIYTQRAVLHDPSDFITSRFYGGRPDALWDGVNIELTNRLTLQRRPGLSPFSTFIYPTAPNRAFSFELTDGSIRVIVDTGSTPVISLSSVADSSSGTAVYTGTITGGDSNAYVGLIFQVAAGFTLAQNLGTYVCVASTSTTLTLANPTATAETASASAVSAGAVYWDQQNGSSTILFAKASNAGQTYFVAVAGVLYMGDGVDIRKYTPNNANGVIWNWGGHAPSNQPGVVITSSGSSAVNWQANTVFSTMGLLVDGNGNVQQLSSVNVDGSNPNSRFGTSGSGAPWTPSSQVPGNTTTESTGLNWINFGPIKPWAANTFYQNFSSGGTEQSPCFVYDAVTNSVYGNANHNGNAGTSGSTRPNFVASVGAHTSDNGGDNTTGISWSCVGTPTNPSPSGHAVWQPGHSYQQFGFPGDGIVYDPYPLPPPANQEVYAQVAQNSGTSAATGVQPFVSTTPVGGQTADGQLGWISLGSATRNPNTAYIAWFSGQTIFSVILDTNNNLQVCTASTGPSSSTPTASITWGTAYGSQTTDGGVIWTCVGQSLAWTVNTIWYLPVPGFAPPQSSQAYGGADVVDTEFVPVIETVINSGLSGGSAPSWNGLGQNTTDNTITWFGESVHEQFSLAWIRGYVYAYSFKARRLTDSYSPAPLGGGLTPPGLSVALGTPTGSQTGAITTASPVFTIIGPNAGAVNTVSGLGPTDTQFDTIVIWRSADGGGPANMFELTEIPAPSPVGGIAQPWSFKDYLPDVPTSQFPGLNNLIPAPIDDENDPPPTTFLPMAYNFQRIWGAAGNQVLFSGGPDVITGNPNEAFNPSDEFPFLANVTRLVKNAQGGLVVFLPNSIEVIGGGPLTSSFYSVTICPGIGLLNYNACDVYAGEIFFFSSDSQFMVMSPSLQLSSIGFPIGDKLAMWDASQAQIAVQQAGTDNGIMVSDGSTGWYRCNPRQVPGGYTGPEPIWSPFAAITNGAMMVQSVEISPGVKKLLVGNPSGGFKILKRDLTVFSDDGVGYPASFEMGNIVLAHPGQLAILKFIECDFSGHAFKPTMSFLLNEISGSFITFSSDPQFDPPSLYGTTVVPGSYSPNRYYFAGVYNVARCRHLRIKCDYGSGTNGDEMYNLTIFGRLMVEG